ncbi:hypothetical protein WKT22_02501 [Candidatus Lokiarchaeum ossiferum]
MDARLSGFHNVFVFLCNILSLDKLHLNTQVFIEILN